MSFIAVQANTTTDEKDRLSDDEIMGQMSYVTVTFLSFPALTSLYRSLIFAATDTTSGALAHVLELLAEHPDIQEKAREEVVEALNGNEFLSFEELHALPYLDAVCKESLRL